MIIKDNNKRKNKLSTKPSDYKDAINDEAILGKNDHSLAAVETGFYKNNRCTTKHDLIDASIEGISVLHLKGNDRGLMTDL